MNETFTQEQVRILERHVTNVMGNVFVLKNLPQVICGALFSKYSRSILGLRSLFLKEFVLNEESVFDAMTGRSPRKEEEDDVLQVKKAQSFYDRVLDGYGDDSIGELGGAHIAFESVSMLAAKVLEEGRIGGSPLEKSTRYVFFQQKINGQFLYHKESVLMTSAYRETYEQACDHLFSVYAELISPMMELMEKTNPCGSLPPAAHAAAVRSGALDVLRALLPASTLTNVGIFGNGRFFVHLLQRLHGHNLGEMRSLGAKGFQELSKIIPSFIRQGDPTHRHYMHALQYKEEVRHFLKKEEQTLAITNKKGTEQPGVRLLAADTEKLYQMGAALLFEHAQVSLETLEAKCRAMSPPHLLDLFSALAAKRKNRRDKSPRALELVQFTFEIVADFGVYRDMQRHRMLTQERQLLTCHLGYVVPPQIADTEMEAPYRAAMDRAREAYELIVREFPEEAQYVVPMGYNVRWYITLNLRALQWLSELRSSPQGHSHYRFIAQEMASQAGEACPFVQPFLAFVDYEGYELGRLSQEVNQLKKPKTI